MQVTIKKPGVPPGNYLARFSRIENVENQYGTAIRWVFTINSGPYTSKEISRFTTPDFTLTNAAGKMAEGVAGRKLEADEEIDLDQYFGKLYQVEVELAPKGESTRVARCYPANPELTVIHRGPMPRPPELPTMDQLILAGAGHQPNPE